MRKVVARVRNICLLVVFSCLAGCGSTTSVGHDPAPQPVEPRDPPTLSPSGQCPEGLVGWWRFENESGPVLDECHSHHGTAFGSGYERKVMGRQGHAIEFNGTDGYVLVEASAALDFLTAGTIELWLRVPTPTPRHHGQRGISWPVGATFARGMGYDDDNVLQNTSCGNMQTIFSRANGGGTTNVTTDCNALPGNVWTHIAVVNDGQRLLLYHDAELIREVEGGYLGPIADDLYIGGRRHNEFPLSGAIDELKWWNIARTQREICADAGGTWLGSCSLGGQ